MSAKTKSYEYNKKYYYAWRMNNIEKAKEYDRRRKYWKSIQLKFMKILLDE